MLNSIRLKLFTWFLITFTLIFSGIGILLYVEFREFTFDQIDEQLLQTVHTISSPLVLEAAQGQLEMELWELSHIPIGDFSEKLSGHYYQILSSQGEILSRSPSLSLADISLPVFESSKTATFKTVAGPDEMPLRLVSKSIEISDDLSLTLQVALSLKDTYSLLRSVRDLIILILPIVFILSGLLVPIITMRALKPLNIFSGKISQITEENLNTRVDAGGVPMEVKPLAESFNTMLGRIEEAFSRQRQFLSDASHELRTPTSIIKSYCDVTLSRERTADNYRETIQKIGNSVDRMCDIINRILIISRLDTKTVQLKSVSIDLLNMMRNVVKLIEPAAASRDIKINLDGTAVHINGDMEGLTGVFTNIVENAIKYNKPGGRVDVHVAELDDKAMITVTDTGIGIPSDEISRIFDRFYRVDTSRGQTVGSGLGLSIVKAIIEAHGGTIHVESAVGKGSTFRVILPR